MIYQIFLSARATQQIVGAATRGYEAPYKEERLGILFGRVAGGIARVQETVIYRGGSRTRTEATVDPYRFERRVNDLQNELKLGFLGSFHTHNEVASTISSSLSQADKAPLNDNLHALVEVVAAIWVGSRSVRQAQYYLQLSTSDGYRIRVAGYACQQGFKCLPVFSRQRVGRR
jgi:hypothetical protein